MTIPTWSLLEDRPGVLEPGSSDRQADNQNGDTRGHCGVGEDPARDTSPRGLARTGLFRMENGGSMCWQ